MSNEYGDDPENGFPDNQDGFGNADDPSHGSRETKTLEQHLVDLGVDPDEARKLDRSHVPKAVMQKAIERAKQEVNQAMTYANLLLSQQASNAAPNATSQERSPLESFLNEGAKDAEDQIDLLRRHGNAVVQETISRITSAQQRQMQAEQQYQMAMEAERGRLVSMYGEDVNKFWGSVNKQVHDSIVATGTYPTPESLVVQKILESKQKKERERKDVNMEGFRSRSSAQSDGLPKSDNTGTSEQEKRKREREKLLREAQKEYDRRFRR